MMKMRIFYVAVLLSLLFLAVQCGKSEKVSDISGVTGAGTEAITGGGTLTTEPGAPTVGAVSLPTGVVDNVWSTLTFQAEDPQGDPFNYRIIYTQSPGMVAHDPPDAATAAGAAVTTPTVNHQLNHGELGTYIFNIEVEDDRGNLTVSGPYQIEVTQPIAQAPSQEPAPLSATLSAPIVTEYVTGQSYTFSLNVSDPDNVKIQSINWKTDEKSWDMYCFNRNPCAAIIFDKSGPAKWVEATILDKMSRKVVATVQNITVEDAAAAPPPPPPPPAVSCATSDATWFRMSVNGDWRGGTAYWWLDLLGIDNFTGFNRKTLTGGAINTGPIANFDFRLRSTGNCVNVESSYLTVREIHVHWLCSDESQTSRKIYDYLTHSQGYPDYKFPSARVCPAGGNGFGFEFPRP